METGNYSELQYKTSRRSVDYGDAKHVAEYFAVV